MSIDLGKLTEGQYQQYLKIQEWSVETSYRYYLNCTGGLTNLERSERIKLIKFILSYGELKLSELLERLRADGLTFTRADLSYLLDTLIEQGLVQRRRQGRYYLYYN